MMKLNYSRGALIGALVILFFALMILNNAFLRGVRIDLTDNNLYTLSEGTRNILGQIQEPINLYLFFSEKETKDLPQLRTYYNRVKEVLEEYRLLADGKLKVHYVNPEAFSEEEDRATKLGLQAATTRGSSDKIYFGIVGTNALDATEVIPFLQTEREAFLEYDLDKLIYSLMRVKKPVLGLMTELPMHPKRINPIFGRTSDPWVITEQLEQLFDVRLVPTDAQKVDEKVDVLMVVHPQDLSERTMYAIDQFVMRGGRGVFFVDPYSEADASVIPSMRNSKDRSSNLNRLFDAWGFSVDGKHIIGDLSRALQVAGQTQQPAAHPAALGMRSRDFNHEDVVMSDLESINFYLASHVTLEAGSQVEMTPYVQTTKQAMPIPAHNFLFLKDPRALFGGFEATGERYVLAARLQGTFKSAFDGYPKDAPEEKKDDDDGKPKEKYDLPHVAETTEPGVVAVVADTDLLSDQMWVKASLFFGQRFLQPFANNRDFVVNMVDNLFGSNDLISIRSRASYSRPFTLVQEIEEQASEEYRATEKSLLKELKETENKLQELQEKRADKKSSLLTASQRKEVQDFQKKKIEIRKKLRNVRHQLVKDVENLGTWLKLLNVVAVPVLLIIAALLAGFMRVRRRKRGVAAGSGA